MLLIQYVVYVIILFLHASLSAFQNKIHNSRFHKIYIAECVCRQENLSFGKSSQTKKSLEYTLHAYLTRNCNIIKLSSNTCSYEELFPCKHLFRKKYSLFSSFSYL